MAAIARGEQRRALVIAGGGFVLVLLLFLGSRLLGGGGGDTAAEPDGGPPTSAPAPDSVPPGGVPGPAEEVPVVAIPPVPDAFEALELRDPFTPPLAAIEFLRSLIPVAPSEPAPGTAPAPGTPPAPGSAPSPASGTVQLRSIDLVDGREVATLDVEGTVFEAGEGERFGSNDEFIVVTLDQAAQCGTFLFGDEAFSLCAGQSPQAPPSAGSTPQK